MNELSRRLIQAGVALGIGGAVAAVAAEHLPSLIGNETTRETLVAEMDAHRATDGRVYLPSFETQGPDGRPVKVFTSAHASTAIELGTLPSGTAVDDGVLFNVGGSHLMIAFKCPNSQIDYLDQQARDTIDALTVQGTAPLCYIPQGFSNVPGKGFPNPNGY